MHLDSILVVKPGGHNKHGLPNQHRFIAIKYPPGILVIPLESDQRNMFTMRVKNPQWMDEVEQLGLLLDSINRLSQSDRSLYFSPRNAGDTIFKFE